MWICPPTSLWSEATLPNMQIRRPFCPILSFLLYIPNLRYSFFQINIYPKHWRWSITKLHVKYKCYSQCFYNVDLCHISIFMMQGGEFPSLFFLIQYRIFICHHQVNCSIFCLKSVFYECTQILLIFLVRWWVSYSSPVFRFSSFREVVGLRFFSSFQILR